jgi:hypothetical protein
MIPAPALRSYARFIPRGQWLAYLFALRLHSLRDRTLCWWFARRWSRDQRDRPYLASLARTRATLSRRLALVCDADRSKGCTMEEPGVVHDAVLLRDVRGDDLPVFFEQERDPVATAMAAFPVRQEDELMAHWREILGDATIAKKTFLCHGEVVGNIVSFGGPDAREVGYWFGRRYWGRGVATGALSAFLDLVTTRPLYAHVARHSRADQLRATRSWPRTPAGPQRSAL